ncbi:MAG: hypothetical protein MUF14_03580 [Hyphomonadaceae bacterium]|jgi:hydrogenase expression/formation protein HypE|nr:hypothetical protein [Hyphomonadaceae bacterium]
MSIGGHVTLEALQASALGSGVAIIGQAVEDSRRMVQATTGFGGTRLVEWRAGEPLPRIC